jgi:hypothetical protein
VNTTVESSGVWMSLMTPNDRFRADLESSAVTASTLDLTSADVSF